MTAMFVERPEFGSLFGMTAHLLSMMFILTVIMMGAPAPLQ
jgi:hypothetical protein